MKSLYLRSIAAAACAVSLAACGGGGGNLILGGSVSGLAKDGLILSNGAATVAVTSGASSFMFPDLIENDANFDIQVKQQPTGAQCQVQNGTGKANSYNVTTVVVSCLTNQYKLGGTITGLTAAGLVLVNGSSDSVSPAANAGSFTFPGTVGDGSPYGVTVRAQPAGLTCSVLNDTGRMGSADVNNLQVSCAAAQ